MSTRPGTMGYLETYRKTGVAKVIGIGREVIARRKDGVIIDVDLSIGEWRDDCRGGGSLRAHCAISASANA